MDLPSYNPGVVLAERLAACGDEARVFSGAVLRLRIAGASPAVLTCYTEVAQRRVVPGGEAPCDLEVSCALTDLQALIAGQLAPMGLLGKLLAAGAIKVNGKASKREDDLVQAARLISLCCPV